MDDTLMIFLLIAAIVWIQVLSPPKIGVPPQNKVTSEREPVAHMKAAVFNASSPHDNGIKPQYTPGIKR
jgi:hypothetical protein